MVFQTAVVKPEEGAGVFRELLDSFWQTQAPTQFLGKEHKQVPAAYVLNTAERRAAAGTLVWMEALQFTEDREEEVVVI